MTLRNVTLQDDFHVIAKLILETDPYIYFDLFGSYENAAKALPLLFSKGVGIFKTDNYFLAEENGRIIGIAALFRAGDEWEEEEVKLAFLEAGVPLAESFFEVSEYFKSVHNYQPGTKACNVCVEEESRGKGYGSQIIKLLLDLAGNSNVILTVLADNKRAIKLYKHFGFKILHDFLDYGGYRRPKVQCYSMIRLAQA